MFSTLATLIEPGDEVVVMDPTYFGYRPLLEYFGASIKRVATSWKTASSLTPSA
jgi:aspartate aminotransferase